MDRLLAVADQKREEAAQAEAQAAQAAEEARKAAEEAREREAAKIKTRVAPRLADMFSTTHLPVPVTVTNVWYVAPEAFHLGGQGAVRPAYWQGTASIDGAAVTWTLRADDTLTVSAQDVEPVYDDTRFSYVRYDDGRADVDVTNNPVKLVDVTLRRQTFENAQELVDRGLAHVAALAKADPTDDIVTETIEVLHKAPAPWLLGHAPEVKEILDVLPAGSSDRIFGDRNRRYTSLAASFAMALGMMSPAYRPSGRGAMPSPGRKRRLFSRH